MWASLICQTSALEGTMQIPCRLVGEIIAVSSTLPVLCEAFCQSSGCQGVLDTTGVVPCLLFVIFLGRILRPSCSVESLGTLRIASLIFADDVVLLASLLCTQNALGPCHHDPTLDKRKANGWLDGWIIWAPCQRWLFSTGDTVFIIGLLYFWYLNIRLIWREGYRNSSSRWDQRCDNGVLSPPKSVSSD